MSEDRTPQKRRLYLCYIYAQYFDNLTPPFLTGTSSLSLSLSLCVSMQYFVETDSIKVFLPEFSSASVAHEEAT